MTDVPTGGDIYEGNRWLRLAGGAGLLFCVLFIVQIFIVPQSPDYNARSSAIVNFYTQNERDIELGAVMTVLFSVLYGVFLAGVWGALRFSNAVWLATLGLVAGAGNTATLFAGHALNVALANEATSLHASDTGPITTLFKMVGLLTTVFNTSSDGLSVLAFSTAILLSGVFTGWVRWIGWIGVISGVAMLIGALAVFDPMGPAAGAGMIGGLAWVIWLISMSIRLVRGAPVRTDVPQTMRQAASATQ